MFKSIGWIVLALAGVGAAQAAEFCVTNSAQFQAALDAAETNGQDDVIRLATGFYPAPAGGFVYDAPAATGGDAGALTVMGGWSEFFGNACGQLLQETPWATQIDGQNAERGLMLRGRPGSRFTVRLLTFAFGAADTGGLGRFGGGLSVSGDPSLSGNVTVERNVFLSNRAVYGGGLYVKDTGDPGPLGRVAVVNNLFLGNDCVQDKVPGGAGGAAARIDVGVFHDALYFSNNTVLNNTADPDCIVTGAVWFGGGSRRYVANNILWGNDGHDLYGGVGASPSYHLLNNNYKSHSGLLPHVASGNIIAVAPEFEPGLFSFTPVRNSALVDAGRQPTPITQWPGFYLTDQDLDAAIRVVGSTVDIGAYENERIFGNGFELDGPL